MNNEYFKNFIKGFLGIFAYLFFNFASVYILQGLGVNVSELTKKQSMFISMIISFIVLAILIILSWKKLKTNFKDYKSNWKSLLSRNVKYWFCSIAFMFAFNLAIALIFNRVTSANDQTIRNIFETMPIYIIFEAVILAPFTEELVFRQSLRYMIKNKWVFIILSGLIFGFMHTLASLETLADFLYIIPYSIPGCFFAYMLVEEDNILVPISFHIIHNSLALLLLVIGKIVGVA